MVSLQAGLFVVGAGSYLLRAAAAAAALGLCSALSAQIRESSAAAWWQGCRGAGLRVRFRGVALAFVAGVAAPFGGLAAAPAPAAGVLDALERGLAAVARHDLVVVLVRDGGDRGHGAQQVARIEAAAEQRVGEED